VQFGGESGQQVAPALPGAAGIFGHASKQKRADRWPNVADAGRVVVGGSHARQRFLRSVNKTRPHGPIRHRVGGQPRLENGGVGGGLGSKVTGIGVAVAAVTLAYA
jgi:hypothetical protein